MKRLFVCTLGFDEKFAIRSFTRHGLEIMDKVLLFTAKPINERVEKAYSIIRSFITFHHKALVELYAVTLDSFSKSVRDIRLKLTEELKNGNYDKVIVNLTGGLRALVLATYTAFLLLPNDVLSGREVIIEVEFEDSSRLILIPPNTGLILRNLDKLKDRHKEVLAYLANKGDASIIELSTEFKLDTSTIRRYIYDLSDLGLVHERSDVKPTRVRIDESAYMII